MEKPHWLYYYCLCEGFNYMSGHYARKTTIKNKLRGEKKTTKITLILVKWFILTDLSLYWLNQNRKNRSILITMKFVPIALNLLFLIDWT